MSERHKHADLIIAWANGAQIQYSMNNLHWADDTFPDWRSPYYRIKPKPKVKKWRWVFSYGISLGITTDHWEDYESCKRHYPRCGEFIQKIDSTMIEVDDDTN